MHLNLLFTAGGEYVEKASIKVAQLLGLGPTAVAEAIEACFGDETTRLERLDELYISHQSSKSDAKKPKLSLGISKTDQKLHKLCGQILNYTDRYVFILALMKLSTINPISISSALPPTQTLAFRCIVSLTTRYIGLRHFFLKHLAKKCTHLSQTNICEMWRNENVGGDKEWNFFLEYAAYCISGPDDITGTVEAMKPSDFGSLDGGLCISNRLANSITM